MLTGDLIDQYKRFFIVGSIGAVVLGPRDWVRRLDALGLGNWNSMRLARNGPVESYYQETNIMEMVRTTRGPDFNLTFVNGLMSLVLLAVGDHCIREELIDGSEVMQFLRHVRNAVAHGGTFDIRKDEPRLPAFMRRPPDMNGDREITRDLQGVLLFPQFIALGDAMDLLDEVKAYVTGSGLRPRK